MRLNKNVARRALLELRATAIRPQRVLHLADRESRQLLTRRFRRLGSPEVGRWEEQDGWGRRSYGSYEEYRAHQASKLDLLDLRDYEACFAKALSGRIEALDLGVAGRPVLCLAARLGAEVRVFKDAGAFAVGLDLNPGPDNLHVLHGDFHDLQFPDRTAALVYCNALDHAFDVDRIIKECARVLTGDGTLMLEIAAGEEEQPSTSFAEWEATGWPTVQALVERVAAVGFEVERRLPFTAPWVGESVLLRPSA